MANNFTGFPSAFMHQTHIDLTLDEEDSGDGAERVAKRARTENSFDEYRPPSGQSFSETHIPSSFSPYRTTQTHGGSFSNSRPISSYPSDTSSHQTLYRPPFVPPPFPPPLARNSSFATPSASTSHVIDLTGSPSPPPRLDTHPTSTLPPELSPKSPVCIGQLTVTALVLYPVQYILPRNIHTEAEWAPVRLQHEHDPLKHDSETIHIQVPHTRTPNGDIVPGDAFGVVEQKVATSLGPMLGKGLIRLDAKVRKAPPNVFSLSSLIIDNF